MYVEQMLSELWLALTLEGNSVLAVMLMSSYLLKWAEWDSSKTTDEKQ